MLREAFAHPAVEGIILWGFWELYMSRENATSRECGSGTCNWWFFMGNCRSGNPTDNIIVNHDFYKGLYSWHPNCCNGFIVSANSGNRVGLSPKSGGNYAVIKNRTEHWQGLEQDITSKISPGSTYSVSACVGVSGSLSGSTDVMATLKLLNHGSGASYMFIGKTSVSKGKWEMVEGIFSLPTVPNQLLMIQWVIRCPSSSKSEKSTSIGCSAVGDEVIINPQFENGLSNWSGRGCQVVLHDSMVDGKILPETGKFFASASERTQNWNGIQQEITGRVQRKLAYNVTAVVRIFGNNVTTATIQATLWVHTPDRGEQYIGIGKVQATDKDWVQLQGKFLLNGSPSRVIIYLEGPPPGIDILVNALSNPDYGVNIVTNSQLSDGTDGWFPLGNCNLSAASGSPKILPPMARDSLGVHEPLSGRYPAQMITDKLKLFLTYQVSAWVRIGSGASGPQNVNVALGVDNQWVNGGQAEIKDRRWHEIGVQGPAAGVDLMVAGLQIFPVDRVARFKHLARQTDKTRKRDIILQFSGSESSSLFGTSVTVMQTQNKNEDFVDFFVKNFNWAVFGNELKWYWTEPQRGNFNYKDADDMLALCQNNKIETRGHSLNKNDLMKAVQNRLTGLLTRYKGKFRHYDVNNEMLHGSFYQDRLGKDIRTYMFKTANQLDPSATLFVNDYHVEDGTDTRSYPKKYIEQILDLQQQGAPVGGIGIQGHIDNPVGPIVCSALDKLGVVGLPIWFTELDVSSLNEHIRGEDLEVMLREAFAHPAVEGVMLWGFWELFMSRDNAHLVDAEGEINEAGKRFLALKHEWLSHAHGRIDIQGQFEFRGFHGTYVVEVETESNK
ncbi:hypothetical protein ES319_1Z054800v1, partial [Gossypium barbadense]